MAPSYVAAPVAERRREDRQNAQSKVEVLTKLAGSNHFGQIAVAGSHDTDVHRSVLVGSDTPDLLLNNAGLINRNAPLWKIQAKEFDAVIDTNLKGTANTIRHFAPAMIERGSGVIVNFSSGWGRSTDAEVAPYCATKWAIEGLTQSLAQELPAGMAAIPLNPGIIDTEMLRSSFGGSASAYPSPSEWAKSAVPFLLKLGPKDNGKPLTVPIRGAND